MTMRCQELNLSSTERKILGMIKEEPLTLGEMRAKGASVSVEFFYTFLMKAENLGFLIYESEGKRNVRYGFFGYQEGSIAEKIRL